MITPVILTLNEAPNIARTLARLRWAKRIVVVDSGSTDATISIISRDPRVHLFQRAFDSHAKQWQFAIDETEIDSPFILRLDADYCLSEALIFELQGTNPPPHIVGYEVAFDYAVCGQMLRSSLYPPKTVLFRKGHARAADQGHTEVWIIDGPVASLSGRIVHDDRKSAESWTAAQARYMTRELPTLQRASSGLKNMLRRVPPLMPFAVFLYCLFGRGLIFNGRAGLFYALQRMTAELILSLALLESRILKEYAQEDATRTSAKVD